MAAYRRQPEVIDLLSDDSFTAPMNTPPAGLLEIDDDGVLSPVNQRPFGFFGDLEEIAGPAGAVQERQPRGRIYHIDGEDVFIPDDEAEPAPAPAPATTAPVNHDGDIALTLHNEQTQAGASIQQDRDMAMSLAEQEITIDVCLVRVLEIFADISHDHVTKLWNEFDEKGEYENLSGPVRLDNIMEQLLSATSYPKQEKGQSSRKRKREDSTSEVDTKRWESDERELTPGYLRAAIQTMLKADFPEFSVAVINETLATQKHLYQAYLFLTNAKDREDPRAGRGRPSAKLATANIIALNSGWPTLVNELKAAREQVHVIRQNRAAEDAKKQAEEANLQRAKERGETAECSACFDDLPLNRQIHCDGTTAHFICYDCIETYIGSEVSEARCRVLCTAGCNAIYPAHQLSLLANKQLLDKLAVLEQEKAIRDADLEDLEDCPFCDYKAIMPPIEENFEFRCANPECEKTSCRRCKAISHIPMSCEEHAKDNKLNSRHKIEEAMTAAMVRSCKKCKKQFIKEYGCNKMTCPSCSNLQCYVCSESIRDYNHFDQGPGRAVGGGAAGEKCPLYDNVEERHEREVKEAEAKARAKVLEENPDVQQADLEIKVSDAVKKASQDRARGAGGVVGLPGMPPGFPGFPGYPGYAGLMDAEFERMVGGLAGAPNGAALQQRMREIQGRRVDYLERRQQQEARIQEQREEMARRVNQTQVLDHRRLNLAQRRAGLDRQGDGTADEDDAGGNAPALPPFRAPRRRLDEAHAARAAGGGLAAAALDGADGHPTWLRAAPGGFLDALQVVEAARLNRDPQAPHNRPDDDPPVDFRARVRPRQIQPRDPGVPAPADAHAGPQQRQQERQQRLQRINQWRQQQQILQQQRVQAAANPRPVARDHGVPLRANALNRFNQQMQEIEGRVMRNGRQGL